MTITTKLSDLRESDFFRINESMKKCIGYINHIDALLKISLTKKNFEERAKLDFSFPVSSIENEPGYLIFLEMIGVEFDPPDNIAEMMKSKPEGFVPLAYLLPAMKEPVIPGYPWTYITESKSLYFEEIEDIYKELDQNSMDYKTERDARFARFNFPAEYESYMAQLSEYPRSREIINIYMNYLLAKDLGFKVNLAEPFTPELKPTLTEEGREINNTKKILKEIFHSHFKQLQNKKKVILPIYTDASDPYWDELLNTAKVLSTKFTNLEKENDIALQMIRNDASEKEARSKVELSIKKTKLEDLFLELIDFFNKNDIPYKNPENEKEIIFPLVKDIKNIKPGGPKLVKKITDGDGDKIKGFQKIGESFKEFYFRYRDFLTFSPGKNTVEGERSSLD